MNRKEIINFNEVNGYESLIEKLHSGKSHSAISLPRSVRLPFLAAIKADLQSPILFITSKPTRLLGMHQEFGFWDKKTPNLVFGEPSTLFFEKGSWALSTRRERLRVLSNLAGDFIPSLRSDDLSPIIFASAKSIMTRTVPRRIFIKHIRRIEIDDEIPIEELVKEWVKSGYVYSEIVISPGQFSRRGGLLDIWPFTEDEPARIEYFGNTIDTLRFFDPATQRSTHSIERLIITPGSEAILAGEENLDAEQDEFAIPLIYKSFDSLLNYLPKDALILLDNAASVQTVADEIETKALDLQKEYIMNGTLTESYPAPFITWSEISDLIQQFNTIDLGYPIDMNEHMLSDSFSPSPRFGGQMREFVKFVSGQPDKTAKIFIVSKQIERLKEIKDQYPDLLWDEKRVYLIQASLYGGWRSIDKNEKETFLFTDNEIFGWKRPVPRVKHTRKYQSPEFSYNELKPGDLVVHIDFGIGRFAGLVSRTIGGIERDYLKILYAKEDELFVPVHQADRLSLYVGPDVRIPRLSNFGSVEWGNTKKKVKEAVKQVAGELLELYTHRHLVKGFPYSEDTDWQRQLESSFPYPETPDQIQAISEIKEDMQSEKPMDRLLCGDVGYGKTEVALRAAFKAVMDGKQTAMLVPTTILAQQHFETFFTRLLPFPVKVEMLSRFRNAKEQEEILSKLVKNEIDIIIGTHRLLQSDVNIPNLGLLIIDEEQRFGVSHKEFFKKMRREVDVLTLTATPIPRTLYMALSGIRDISVINSPPAERMPTQTYIGEYDPGVIRRAVMREIDRGGQVFFVHNRVQTISAMGAQLEKIVPEARIGIAHGQMKEDMLSDVMHRFNAGEIDVLLSTSIIESGLDIPNANTLIVDRGDTFGLAQLYQLRGRVGRGTTRAYAYLFHNRNKNPTPEGLERLETIAENTQLGAGYSIALRDLEMRGAGELLGTQQHGFIASVGFHLYTRMLANAVNENRKQGEKIKIDQFTEKMIRPLVSIDLPIYTSIPKEYIPNDQLRLNLYRRMADIQELAEIERMKEEFLDRFGEFDSDLQNLFWLVKIRILATKIGLSQISLDGKNIILRFPLKSEDHQKPDLIQMGNSVRTGKSGYWLKYHDNNTWQQDLTKLLDQLINLKKKVTVTNEI